MRLTVSILSLYGYVAFAVKQGGDFYSMTIQFPFSV